MKPAKHVAVFIETSREYGRGLLRGVTRFHHERGTWAISFKPQDLSTDVPRWLKGWPGDGILARITNKKMARAVLATKLPFVDLRGASWPFGTPAFGIEIESVCQIAYAHLVEIGLRKFAFVGEPRGLHVYDDERRDCFRSLVEKDGYECFNFDYSYRPGQATNEESERRRFLRWVAGLPRPIGILASHDDRGMQVLEACRILDIRVPDEVAVVGLDNDEFLCNLSIPSLTSVDLNSERIGYEAARLLDDMMYKRVKFNQPRYFPPVGIVARQSTDMLAVQDVDIAVAIRMIRQHACQRLTVSDVEQKVAMSRSLFNRKFKQLMGRTPKAEILRVQLEKAMQLLRDTELPVAQIASLAGFSEPKYFIAVFGQRIGLTPRAFRAKHGRFDGLSIKDARPRR